MPTTARCRKRQSGRRLVIAASRPVLPALDGVGLLFERKRGISGAGADLVAQVRLGDHFLVRLGFAEMGRARSLVIAASCD